VAREPGRSTPHETSEGGGMIVVKLLFLVAAGIVLLALDSSLRQIVVSVFELRLVEKGSLQAFASVEIGNTGWKLYDVRLIKEINKKAWVALPQTSWEGPDGKKHYSRLSKLRPA
jgi:hypothetical protein